MMEKIKGEKKIYGSVDSEYHTVSMKVMLVIAELPSTMIITKDRTQDTTIQAWKERWESLENGR